MTYLIGHGLEGKCPVCELGPIAIRPLPSLPAFAECPRCGLVYRLVDAAGRPLQKPVCPIAPGFIQMFREYWAETEKPLGPPPAVLGPAFQKLDPLHRARAAEVEDWLRAHPHRFAAATAPSAFPYVSITAIVAEQDGRKGWALIPPPAGFHADVGMPVSHDALPIGTIVTIAIPIRQTAPAQAPASSAPPEKPNGGVGGSA